MDERPRRSTRRAIRGSRRRITILFTDLKGSTSLWEEKGDVEARLLVDRHNRLLLRLIQSFRGRVLKTIGDSFMASFKRSKDAVRAAVAIQQSLESAREDDPDFDLRVRIGIHTGHALVERDDVYGDVVNVAARIESKAGADQILISMAAARGLDRRRFALEGAGKFKPKGKRKSVQTYRVRWERLPDLTRGVSEREFLPVHGRQRAELLAYAVACGAFLYALHQKYLRYLLADSERLAPLQLDPAHLLNLHPAAGFGLGAVALLAAIVLLRLRSVPTWLLGALQGGAGFALACALLWGAAHVAPLEARLGWSRPLFESRHLFVEILEDDTWIREQPDLSAPTLRSVDAGVLLLLADVHTRADMTWNEVYLGPEHYGFVARAIPARPGAPRKRLSIADKFVLRVWDAAALAAGALGFLLGFLRFRLRPL